MRLTVPACHRQPHPAIGLRLIPPDTATKFSGDDFDQILLELALGQAGAQQMTAQGRCHLLEECCEKKEEPHPNTHKIAIGLGRAYDGVGEVIVGTAAFYEHCRPLVDRPLVAMARARQGAALQAQHGGRWPPSIWWAARRRCPSSRL